MKLALVYDRIIKFGGAERVLLALHEIWPDAPLYTAVYNKKTASWADDFDIRTSFLNKLPFLVSNHEMLPLLTPYAFESFRFDEFDVVLTITSSDAKAILTSPNTRHICYMLTPTRYLWNGFHNHLENPGFGLINPVIRSLMKVFSPGLRKWDYIASGRPDYYLSISETVSRRIQTFYKRSSTVIYPPVDTEQFKPSRKITSNDYFLIVSRLVPYKNIESAIYAFNILGWKLKIIGNGIDENRLKKLAKRNVEFINNGLTDEKLCWYYQNCQGFIFPGEEDFGISAAEAQSCGKPVIGLNKGGLREIIISGKTGELYDDGYESLINTLKLFIKKKYSISDCRNNALRFAKKQFQKNIKQTIEELTNI